MAETTEKTLAEELREAAARAREHLLPHVKAEVLPQTAIVALCGSVHEESAVMCRACILFDVKDRVLARMVAALINAREPLASWLEKVAEWADETTDLVGGLVFHVACDGVVGQEVRRCECFDHPLAVARVLNGGAR